VPLNSFANTEVARQSLSIDMMGEILLQQTLADQVDTFIIRPEYDPVLHYEIPQCYLLHPGSNCLVRTYHYPLTLSELVDKRQQSIAWSLFCAQLDHGLVDQLLALGLDSLGTYALLTAHPQLLC
jgi:hypothetical protein